MTKVHIVLDIHAVLLLESGACKKFVSQRIDHKTINTTAETYLDIPEKIEEDELQKFVSTINSINQLNLPSRI
ncbi:recombinase XerC [Bacillus sp. AFS053548]|nr:recombinase XerC [Bacillus sp. AFS053548]